MNALTKKRPVMVVLVFLLVAFAVTACGNKTDLTKPSSSSTQTR